MKDDIIKELEQALEDAQKYHCEDGGMKYAYRYGLLRGTITKVIFDLKMGKR